MRTALFLTWPQTMLLWGRYVLYSFKCVHLPDVSCSWLMLLGGDGDEEREHHPTRIGGCMCMFVCVDMLPRVVLAIPSFAPIFSSLLPFPSSPLLFLSSLLSPSLYPPPLPSLFSSTSPSSLLSPFSSSSPSFTPFSTYLPQHSWIQGSRTILCCIQWWSFCLYHI